MRKLVWVLVLVATLAAASAQDLGGTMSGVYNETLGSHTTVEIPNYGVHAVVNFTAVRMPPSQVRDMGLAVFAALANARDGIVSVSIHGDEGFSTPDYVVVFQKLADGTITVYLNGEPF